MGTTYHNKPIVTDGLVFCIDPANKESWTGPDSSNVNDLIGTSTGSIYNGTSGSYGINHSFTFTSSFSNNIGGYIDYGDASYLSGLSQLSVSSWFKLESSTSIQTIISDARFNQSPYGHFTVRITNVSDGEFTLNCIIFEDSTDNGSNQATWPYGASLPKFTIDTWHNFTFTYNAGSVTTYKDGISVTNLITGTIPTTLSTEDGILNIGRQPNISGQPNYYFNGQISETLIYTKALSASEVFQNYNALKNRFI